MQLLIKSSQNHLKLSAKVKTYASKIGNINVEHKKSLMPML